jgi:hypothetical protein
MKAGLITQLYPAKGDLPSAQGLLASMQTLDAVQYNSRSWHRRLPAVLFASLLIAILLLAAGISIELTPWLSIVPLVCLPLAAAVALSNA